MEDRLYDDVKALLDGGFEDDRILKQIFRACRNGEVISSYERDYVRRLARQHLGRRPFSEHPDDAAGPKILPDVVLPDVVLPDAALPVRSQTTQLAPLQKPRSRLRSKKFMVLVALVALLAVGAAVGTMYDGDLDDLLDSDAVPPLQTDLESYRYKDIIQVSGTSGAALVDLSIENAEGMEVWSEQLAPRADDSYSTLLIAGGPGWDDPGRYTLTADDGGDPVSVVFAFRP